MSRGWINASLFRDFQAEGTDAHRLCTMEDGWVERFGLDILISFKGVLVRERLIQELKEWANGIPFKFGRIFARFAPRKSEQREPPRLIFGNSAENLKTIATERRLKFGIDFGAGFSVGLFPDQRENRSFVRHLARKGEKFDVIILDPPTFSRSPGGKTFHVENDFEKLLVDSLELAERDCHVLVSTNCSTLREHALGVMARYGLKAVRRAGTFQRSPPLPDFPPGTGASSIWLTLR